MPKGSSGANSQPGGKQPAPNSAGDRSNSPSGLSKFALRQLSAGNLKSLGFLYSNLILLSPRVIFASIIINLFGLAIPIAILQVYDRIIPNHALPTLYLLCMGLIAIVVLESLLRIARAYVVGHNASKFGHHTSLAALNNILSMNEGQFTNDHASKLVERVNAIGKLADFYGGTSRLLLIDLPFAALFLVFIGLIVGPLVAVPLLLICGFGWGIFKHAKIMRDTLEARDVQSSRMYDFVGETLRGILTLKSAAMEPFILRRFESLVENSAHLNRDLISATSRAQTFASFFGNAVTVTMVTTGAVIAIFGDMTIGMLAAASQLAARAIQPVVRSAASWNEIQVAVLALRESHSIVSHRPEEIAEKSIDYSNLPTLNIIHTENLGSDAAIEIQGGSIIGFTGGDGSGKSSVLKSFSAIADTPWLQARIDGEDPCVYRHNGRQAIGYVTPQTSVFRGTILDNLTLFGGGASVRRARQACEMIGLRKVIDKLPDGYSTRLREGVTEALPQGTIRQIVLARALAQSPKLLLLDEPQAFLDAQIDAELLACLQKMSKQMTILMVTSSPTYLQICDQVFQVTRNSLEPIPCPAPDISTSDIKLGQQAS
ncbi:MAG: ABC transporter transmembrane domain-containing protein [Rhizobiaceae bacterium]